jgi:hypothetical protein
MPLLPLQEAQRRGAFKSGHKSIWGPPSVREFERGALDAERFAKSVVAEMSLGLRWREFVAVP